MIASACVNICLCRCVRKSLHTSVSLIAAASAAAIRSCSACISALSPSTVSPFDSFPNVRAASLLESTSVAPIPAAVLRHRSASFRSASASAFAVLPKQSGFFQFNTKSIYIYTHTHTHIHTHTHTHIHIHTHTHTHLHTRPRAHTYSRIHIASTSVRTQSTSVPPARGRARRAPDSALRPS